VADWRRDVRSHSGNIALLYVAGHGMQMTMEGGIVLLDDFADPKALTPLTGAGTGGVTTNRGPLKA
jgi:hypothetical protein